MPETRIEIEIPGSDEMKAKLAAKPHLVRRAVIKALRLSGESVYAKALLNVSGKILKVQTGTLRRRLHLAPVSADDLSIKISDPVAYAARHEYGFHGLEAVSGHVRHITRAFGRRLQATQSAEEAILGALRGTIGIRSQRFRRTGGRDIVVRPFIRQANTPARPFMRPAINESVPDIRRIFVASISEALEKAQ